MTPETQTAPAIRIPSDLLPADGRFGCGPSRVRPEALRGLGRALRHHGDLASPGPGQRTSSAGSARGLLELFGAPDGYEIVLGNGGATAFWDAAAAGLIRERSLHLTFGEFS